MFGSETLEIGIGIIFVFILVSIICSALREGIEAWLKTRAAYLEHGIRELLHDIEGEGMAKAFYTHPLIFGLFSGNYEKSDSRGRPGMFAKGGELPSYIPSKNFAMVLMDIAARGPKTDEVTSDPGSPIVSLASIRTNVLNIQNMQVQRALLTAIDSAQGDLNKAQATIEAWYNSSMDRVSGRYKRSTNWIIFWIGLFVAVALNINTIAIADYLYRNDAARAALVARASAVKDDPNFINQDYEKIKTELKGLSLPIGWTVEAKAPWMAPDSEGWWKGVFSPLLGWLFTALAATMGAPFWFDILNKVMVIRSTVKPHEKSLEEGSEDRQNQTPPTVEVVAASQESVGGTVHAFAARPPSPRSIPSPRDEESAISDCAVGTDDVTSDEELPAAEGGVA
jgi:hypothetical protein